MSPSPDGGLACGLPAAEASPDPAGVPLIMPRSLAHVPGMPVSQPHWHGRCLWSKLGVTGAGGRGDVPAKILTNAVMLPLLQASCGNCRRGTTYLQWSSRSTTGIPTGWLQRWHAMCTRQWEGRRLCPAELEASPAASETQQLPWLHQKPGAQGAKAECTLLKQWLAGICM